MKQLIENLLAIHQVGTVLIADLKAGGLVYVASDGNHVIINKQLSPGAKIFALLHEIGHLATETLSEKPMMASSLSDEMKAHFWAIEQLQGLISEEHCEMLRLGFLENDSQGYRLAEQILGGFGTILESRGG